MHFKSLLSLVFVASASFTLALPVPERAQAQAVQLKERAFTFVEQDYADFQISDGVGGQAQQQAAAVFLTPFDGIDLSTVDKASRDAVEAMREAAENAETDEFNPQVAAASGAAAAALQVGKIKNKVLKLTGEVQVINIDIAVAKAAGDDTSDLETKLQEEQTKLNTNIKLDTASAGKASKGVA